MKPPVDITALMEEWNNDCIIDRTEPSKELSKIPQLHAKYLRILTHHNLVVKNITKKYEELKSVKLKYYNCDLNNEEDLKKYNLEPNPKKVYKFDMATYMGGDSDLNNIKLKIDLHQEIVNFCSSVLKEISNRTYQLNNIVKWEIFIDGK